MGLGPTWVAFHQARPTQTHLASSPGLAIAKENVCHPEVSVQLVFIIKAKIGKQLFPHTPNDPPTHLQIHPIMFYEGENETCLEKTQKMLTPNERMRMNEIGSDGGLCMIGSAPPRIPGKDGLGVGLDKPLLTVLFPRVQGGRQERRLRKRLGCPYALPC